MKRNLLTLAMLAALLPVTGATAQDLGTAADNLANAGESGFGLADVIIYFAGVIFLIGGFSGFRNGRDNNRPGQMKAAIAGILVGLAILGWKGWTDAFYDTAGIDETGSGYSRPSM